MKQAKIFLFIYLMCGIFIAAASVEYREQNQTTPKTELNKKWPYRDFAYAKAYLYNLENKLYGNHAIIKDGRLDDTVTSDGILLSPAQVEKIIELTNQDIAGLIIGLSKTYIPHHGIVFYDNAHLPVAYITLCIDCEALRVFPEIPFKPITEELSEKKIKELLDILYVYKKILLEIGLPVYNSPFDYGNT